MTRRPALAIVGAGRLSRALAPLLAARGWRDIRIASRRAASARRAAAATPGARAAATPAEAVRGARVVLVAVPDGAIAATAAGLLRDAPAGWRGRVVLHAAGALGPEPLEPLRRAGAATGVLHPLQALGTAALAREAVAGSAARIEGAPAAVRAARRIARDLGLVPLEIPRLATDAGRAAYHAAASMASNDVVVLLALAVDVLRRAGVPPRRARAALSRLATGALVQFQAGGAGAALTGPVARGDDATVARQLRALDARWPAAARIHREISRALADLAVRERVLTPARRRAVVAALAAYGRGRKPGV